MQQKDIDPSQNQNDSKRDELMYDEDDDLNTSNTFASDAALVQQQQQQNKLYQQQQQQQREEEYLSKKSRYMSVMNLSFVVSIFIIILSSFFLTLNLIYIVYNTLLVLFPPTDSENISLLSSGISISYMSCIFICFCGVSGIASSSAVMFPGPKIGLSLAYLIMLILSVTFNIGSLLFMGADALSLFSGTNLGGYSWAFGTVLTLNLFIYFMLILLAVGQLVISVKHYREMKLVNEVLRQRNLSIL